MIFTKRAIEAPHRRRARVPPARLLELDPDALSASFGKRACAVGHALVDSPLLRWEAIAELADRLPAAAVERHAARQPLLRPDAVPRFGGRHSATVLDLERSAWSLVLRNVERADGYRELLDETLDELDDVVAAHGGQASLVLGAPLAVTPARIEAEHLLLLQVRGERQVNVGRFADRAAERRAYQRFKRDAHRNLESIPHDPVAIDLDPGDGVYLAPFAPHWIRNGPSASICLALAFGARRPR